MTDKPTPTTDLLKRGVEIHEGRSTGVLSGEALRDYAKRKWPGRRDTLQMAEHETGTEALALLAKWGQPAQAEEPFCWHWENTFNGGTGTVKKNPETLGINMSHPDYKWTALYTAQPPTHAQAASSAVLKALREANMQLVRTGDDAFMLVPYKAAEAQAAEPVARLVIGKTKGGVSLTHMVVPAAYQLQEGVYALYTAPQPVARGPLPKFLALKFHARRDKKATVTLLFPGHEAADAWVRGIRGGQHVS